MSSIVLNVPTSRSSAAGESSGPALDKFACLVQLASQYYCQAEYASNNAVVAPDSTRGVAINGFDIEVADVSGTVLASAEDKKDEISNTGKRSGFATDDISDCPDDKYVCHICNKIYTYSTSLERHTRKNHDYDLLPFKCDSCDEMFPRIRGC